MRASIFLFRRKTAAGWTSANPVLLSGELGLETDTTKFKFGNGTTAWNSLAYAGASVGSVPWGAITGTLSAQTDLQSALTGKQATLVSGVNIKTINGASILGPGDLATSGDPGITVTTVLAMQGLPAANLASGLVIETRGYFVSLDGGGATYDVMTSGAFGGTPDGFGDHALSGGFVAKLRRTIFYPGQYGAGQDGSGRTSAQNKLAINAMIAKMNLSVRPTAKWDGNWTIDGGPTLITADGTTHTADGLGYITFATSGNRFKTPDADDPSVPEGVVVSNLVINGGWDGVNNLTQPAIQIEGDYNRIVGCQTMWSGGFGVKGFRSRVMFCDVSDVDGGGISVGKSNAALCIGNSVLRSGGEGIQCDEGTDTLILGNYVAECGGVGGFGGNKLEGVMWLGNHAYDNNNGGIVNGNKGDTESLYSGMIGNVLRDNGNRGIQLRAYYTTMPISNITQASIPTITFPDMVITAIDGTVSPVRITIPAHGLSPATENGNRRTITGTPLIPFFTAAGGFPKPIKIQVIDANTLALWNEDAYLEDPVVGNGTWAAAVTSRLSHPFTRTGNPNFNREKLTFSGVVGMTQINGLSAYTEYDEITGIVTLYAEANRNNLTGFDTSGFSAYVSGGTAEFGTVAGKMALIGNLVQGSSTAIRVEIPTPGPEMAHIIQGNITSNPGKVEYRSPLVRGGNVAVRASCFRPSQNNVTGNGLEYTIPFANGDDEYDTDGTVSAGVFTAPCSDMYNFSAGVAMSGMGATVTAAQLSLVHYEASPSTTEIRRVRVNLVPDGGVTSAGTWRQALSHAIFVEEGERVDVRVVVNGLGANTADLVGPGETFLTVNGAG